jgi:hypothetical protein
MSRTNPVIIVSSSKLHAAIMNVYKARSSSPKNMSSSLKPGMTSSQAINAALKLHGHAALKACWALCGRCAPPGKPRIDAQRSDSKDNTEEWRAKTAAYQQQDDRHEHQD